MNRSKAKEIFVKFYCKNRAFCELYPDRCKKEGCEIYHAIKALEAEPKHGLWIKDDIKLGDDYAAVLVCSECDKINWGMVKLNYCPNCGAKMDEVEE